MIQIRTQIEPSNNPKEKDDIYIWVTREESNDSEIRRIIDTYREKYEITIFNCGYGKTEIFLQKFLDCAV